MIACIRSESGKTACGRDIEPREFLFTDQRHAVELYANGPGLMACGKCVEVARAALATSGVPWKGR